MIIYGSKLKDILRLCVCKGESANGMIHIFVAAICNNIITVRITILVCIMCIFYIPRLFSLLRLELFLCGAQYV